MFERRCAVPGLAVVTITILLLAGCTSSVKKETADEPWPELAEQAEDCADISGLYSARPRVPGKTETQQSPLLAYTLLPASPGLAGAETVRIKVTPALLSVTANTGDNPVLSASYTAASGVFSCEAGTLAFHPAKKPGGMAQATVPGLEWETIHLRRTQGGALLLQKADGLANLAFMLFPIYLTTEHWYLFKPAEAVPAQR